MAERPRVVLDTTTLVSAIPSRNPLRPIIEAFDAGRFVLIVSNDILLEYEEILKRLGGPAAWPALRGLLDAHPDDVIRVTPSYHWQAIRHDPDDDKFVDAAWAGDAEWIVTDDRHYKALVADPRFTVRPIPPLDFLERYCRH